jgi:hypothetical protein
VSWCRVCRLSSVVNGRLKLSHFRSFRKGGQSYFLTLAAVNKKAEKINLSPFLFFSANVAFQRARFLRSAAKALLVRHAEEVGTRFGNS